MNWNSSNLEEIIITTNKFNSLLKKKNIIKEFLINEVQRLTTLVAVKMVLFSSNSEINKFKSMTLIVKLPN